MPSFARTPIPSIVVAGIVAVTAARAQPADDANRATARRLAEHGLTEFDHGNYAGALEDFTRAEALVHAPTMNVMAARCLVKLGRLVEASERYLAASRAQLDASASKAFKDAVSDATKERQALTSRIPTLEVDVEGAKASEVEITLDGKPVPAAMVGIARVLDPGSHVVEGVRGSDHDSQNVTLQERQAQRITLHFRPATAAGLASAPPPSAPAAAPSDQPPSPSSGADARRPIGIALIALGAAGIGVGAVAGIVAMGKRSDLDTIAGCPSTCDPGAQGDVDAYNRLRLVSSIGFVAGGALAVAGAVLILTAPSSKPRAATFAPWIGVGRAGARVAF